MMATTEYVRVGGCVCPACGSQFITGGGIEIVYGGAWQNVSCDECSAAWHDTYALTGFETA